ncbi:hypothetical protein ACFC58_06195 [Kitasatospora purpeofusca]|uniref:hypothetical protein n=1 Tax=Kitasatospora purpeofusca TaxID=67352 RepID=UPI0035DB541E
MHETTFTAEDTLEDALTRALASRDIAFETDGHGVFGWVLVELPDDSQIWITDVNSEVSDPLSEYSGMQAVLRSGEEWQVLITVYKSPNLGEQRGLDAWSREVADLLDAVQACIREVSADWSAAYWLANRIGVGWFVEREHDPEVEGRIVRHRDGSALRVYRHVNRRGRARVSVVGHYPATHRPFGPGENPIATVTTGRTPSVLAREVFRNMLPRYRRVRFAIEEFNAERQRELNRRKRLAARVGELLPEVTHRRDDEGLQALRGPVPGSEADVTIRMSVDASLVDLSFEDLPAPWALALLGTLAGLRTPQD